MLRPVQVAQLCCFHTIDTQARANSLSRHIHAKGRLAPWTGRTSNLLIVSENCASSDVPSGTAIGAPSSVSATAKPDKAEDADKTADHKHALLVGMDRHKTPLPTLPFPVRGQIPIATVERA